VFEENIGQEADAEIDQLVSKFERKNNTLQEIKIRKPALH